MLGIVGTMISLSNAMMQVDISQGVQVAINNMTALTGQALNSSIYGIVLAVGVLAILSTLTGHDTWATVNKAKVQGDKK